MSVPTYPVVLIGFMAVGKSTVGRTLAKRWNLPFVDTDQHIVAKHGNIATLFQIFGEPHFRQLEARVVARALEQYPGGVVLSLGGGAVLDTGTQQLLAKQSVIFLDTDLEHVRPRIVHDKRRPLLATNPEEAWQTLAERRRPVYERVGNVWVDTRGKELERIVTEIEAHLNVDSSEDVRTHEGE